MRLRRVSKKLLLKLKYPVYIFSCLQILLKNITIVNKEQQYELKRLSNPWVEKLGSRQSLVLWFFFVAAK